MTLSEYNRLSDGEEGNRDTFHEELQSVEDSTRPSPGASPSQAELDWLNEV